MKKMFKNADKSVLLSAVMPGFHFFTRVRLRCGNRDEILRLGTVRFLPVFEPHCNLYFNLGRQNEIEEIIAKNVTEEAREASWARSSRFNPSRMPGFSLDRSDHGIRNQILASMETQKPLFDEKEIKVEL